MSIAGTPSQRILRMGVRQAIFAATVLAALLGATPSLADDVWRWWTEGIEGTAREKGMWGALVPHHPSQTTSDYNPVHAALLRHGEKGKLLFFRNQLMIIYDLNTNDDVQYKNVMMEQSPPNSHEPFCGGHVIVGDDLLVAGGDRGCDDYCDCCDTPGTPDKVPCPPFASLFENSSDELIRLADMPSNTQPPGFAADSSRWYPTTILLPSGNALVVGGDRWVDAADSCNPNRGNFPRNRTWLEFKPDTLSWKPVENPIDSLWAGTDRGRMMTMPDDYGHVRVMPRGLFWRAWHGGGTELRKSRLWPWPVTFGDEIGNLKVAGHTYGPSVILTLAPPYLGSASSQRIVTFGGGEPDSANPVFATHGVTEMIDFATATDGQGWTQLSDMLFPRSRHNGVLLPDGKVFLSGGAKNGGSAGDWDSVLVCEIFDPDDVPNPSFAEADTLARPRMYHSIGMMLPDGRVLATGNQDGAGSGGMEAGYHYELYYPPYLFTQSGDVAWADRPEIEAFEEDVFYGLPFLVETASGDGDDIETVMLMAPSSVTHSNDFSQRRVVLEFAEVGTDSLMATAPWTPEVAPPGNYMLIIQNEDGVPSVAKFVTLGTATSTAQTGGDEVWGGTARLYAGFTVDTGDTLTILPGPTVYADADASTPIKITTLGRFVAVGTEEDPITFTSMNGTGAAGEWGGLDFALQGCECTGYGYSTGIGAPSVIEHASISSAEIGIAIRDFVAPNLKAVAFENILGDRDITIDDTDVFIPHGYWTEGCESGSYVAQKGYWELEGPTHVVFSNSTSQDLTCVGEEGKADLLVDGKLVTTGAEGDSTFFRPESATDPSGPGAGRDWGGIFFSFYSSGSSLAYADIGYAANPVYLYYPGATQMITHSRIHHFADAGLWAYGNIDGEGPTFDSIVVERGGGLNAGLGSVGVFIDRVDGTDFVDSHVDLTGWSDADPSFGVDIQLNATLCQSPTGSSRTLLVQGNVIEGPGDDNLLGGSDVGLHTDWTCGGGLRDVDVVENTVVGWKQVGMLFAHPESVSVSCNRVIECNNGVEVWRGSTQNGPTINFRENRIEAPFQGAGFSALWTNDASATRLGPDNASNNRGLNELAVRVDSTKFICENDTLSNDILNAKACYWFTYDGTSYSQITSPAHAMQISNRMAPPGWDVDFTPFESSAPSSDCDPPDPASWRIRLESIARDSGPEAAGSDRGVPTEFRLGPPRPNPTRKEVVMTLEIPAERLGTYRLAVFEVNGRRVDESELRLDRAGRSSIEWSLPGESNRTSPGVYFLKLEGPGGIRETRKAVLIR